MTNGKTTPDGTEVETEAAVPGRLDDLERRLGYRFRDRQLLITAMTHRSFANERPGEVEDNEVLEFLGDAVLGLVVSDVLCARHPYLSEGQMSKLKSYLVSADTLSELADEIGLGDFVRLGRGEEKTDGRAKDSILANCFEAIIAALYRDGGLERARSFVLDLVEPLIGEVEKGPPPVRDFKSALQERAQARGLPLPTYRVVEEQGPDHEKVFHVEVTVADDLEAVGRGKTKKRAEQRAAHRALDLLDRGRS